MPWKAIPFANRKVKNQLSKHFGVEGIPTLVILDENRDVISASAVGKVRGDANVENFPWAPELVNDIDVDPEGINDHVCLIVFSEDRENMKTKILKPAAEWCKAQSKAKTDESETLGEFVFFTANTKEGQLASQIHGDCGLGEGAQAIVVDVQDGMAFFNVPEDALASAEKLQEFLTTFANGTKPEKKTIKA